MAARMSKECARTSDNRVRVPLIPFSFSCYFNYVIMWCDTSMFIVMSIIMFIVIDN